MREYAISILTEVKFGVKKDTKAFNTVCTQNILVINDVVKSQHVDLSGKGNDSCFTSINLHMICSVPISHRVYI
jgi:hypothetical protein